MRSIKKAAAVVFAVMAAVLMQTAAFAYTGSGTKTDPYTVYTFDELKELCEGGAYVKLGADINESTFKDIAIKQNTYLDLAGHSLNITNTNSFSTLFFVVDSGCLEISDKGGEINLKDYQAAVFSVNSGGKLIVNSGVISNRSSSDDPVIIVSSGGEATINAGTISQLAENGYAVINKGKTTINGGTFSSNIDFSVSNSGKMCINGGTINNGLSTMDKTLIVSGGSIHNLYCEGTYNEGADIKLYSGTFVDILDLSNLPVFENGAKKISDVVPDGSTVKINGSVIGKDTNLIDLRTASKNKTVEINSSKEYIKKISLTDDLTPICGKSPVYPSNPNASLYNMTAHWYNEGTENEITSFAPGERYILKLDFELKNTNSLFGSFTSVELPYTQSDAYRSYTSAFTDTTLSVSLLFATKPSITKQPYNPDNTLPAVGRHYYVKIEAENAQNYKWYCCDINGFQQDLTSMSAILTAEGITGPVLDLNIVSKRADGYRLYCIVKSGDYSLKSKEFTLNIPKYTVSYDANGGEGSMLSQTIYNNMEFTVDNCSFTRSGMLFECWLIDGVEYEPGDKITVTKDTVAKAKWRYYRLSFNAGSGSGSMDTVQLTSAGPYTLPANKFTAPSGYYFKNWKINGTYYAAREAITLTKDTTATATWEKYCTVSFDPNGVPTEITPVKVKKGDKYTLPNWTYNGTPSGASFDGWLIDGVKYSAGTEITVTKDITAKAKWLRYFTIYYRPNNNDSPKQYYQIGNFEADTEHTLVSYAATGFTAPDSKEFDHWRIDGETCYPGDKVMITKNTYIYAEYVYKGSAGDNCTWRFDEITGTLTVSGTGRMTAYGKDSRPPWYDLKNKIKKVVIEDGITYVGSWSFEGCTQLKEAVLADSVKTIGPFSFRNTGLTGINIPKKLSNIGNDAFVNTSLTYIIMPETITYTLSNCVGYNCDTSTSPYTYTKADGFVVCGYAGTAAETYANNNGFDFIQLGNVNNDANHVVDDKDAALLLKYLSGSAELEFKQTVAAKMTDSIKADSDMLDVIAILNT